MVEPKPRTSETHQTEKEKSNMKKSGNLLWVMALTAALCLSGCKGTQTAAPGNETTGGSLGAAQESREDMSASEEKPEDEKTETEEENAGGEKDSSDSDTIILAVSFGTSFNDSRDITIGAVEKAIAEAIPQYELRRAFTAQIIIDKLKERDGLKIDNVTQALERAAADGIKNLVVQPTHLMDGFEYHDMIAELEEYKDYFDQIVVGKPLLDSDEDFEIVAKAIAEATKDWDDGDTALVFMGHGTEAESNGVYEKLQNTLTDGGYENYYIGTVEAEPGLADVSAALAEAGRYKKVVLRPLMLVAGDHANNDMAGDEEDSWKTVLESEGYEVECQIHGLGELETIQKLYVDHAKKAVGQLK